MKTKTCAACDCELGDEPVRIKIRGKTIEVCCEACARELKQADASASERIGAHLRSFDASSRPPTWLGGFT